MSKQARQLSTNRPSQKGSETHTSGDQCRHHRYSALQPCRVNRIKGRARDSLWSSAFTRYTWATPNLLDSQRAYARRLAYIRHLARRPPRVPRGLASICGASSSIESWEAPFLLGLSAKTSSFLAACGALWRLLD